MKVFMLVAALTISIISWSSLYFLKRRLHPMEIFAYYLFYTIMLQQTFTILTMNLHWFEMTDGALIMWPIKVIGLSFYPIVNLWLLSFLGSGHLDLTKKLIILVLFQALLAAMDNAHGMIGYMYALNWSLAYGIIRHVALLFLTFLFMLYYRKLLRERKVMA